MKKIFLIDGNSFIYRMFFGLPEFSTKDGKVVNAIFGMAKFFVDTLVKQKPDYLIFTTDPKGKTFRNDIYEDYKATRERMPDNLRAQIDDIYRMIEMMGIEIIKKDGFEADDVIGTLATKLGKDAENEVYILSGDKDLYSLITKNVFVYDTMKKKVFDPEAAKEKFGVSPDGIIDYLSIVGDKADNIPGIDGFGPKKAVALINSIGDIESIYAVVKKIESGEKIEEILPNLNEEEYKEIRSCFKGKTFEKLQASYDDAVLSKRLATIDLQVGYEDFDLEEFHFAPKEYMNAEVKEFFKSCEFFSLLGEEEQITTKFWRDLGLKVQTITNDSDLISLQSKILGENNGKDKKVTLDTETTSLQIVEAELLGISIYLDDNNIFYINVGHTGKQVTQLQAKAFLQDILDSEILIIGHNLKYDLQIIDFFLQSDINNDILKVGQSTLF